MGDVITTPPLPWFPLLSAGFPGSILTGFVGLIVSIVVIMSGISIARDTLEPLIGKGVDPKLYGEIKELLESYDGIVGTHDLIVHNYGPGRKHGFHSPRRFPGM